ncbi:DEAD/DEAH box helicase [Streptomyces sp. ISL-22]|uniref:DEAD/DEAH box helicase n=1 Tax=unclassified Streptomyces TaxID=2593676 RepID=UPI001BE8B474|nr:MULTISPECIES: DEAD/DEAH box helicase [unclassified Streptomyces]MBT2420407.1 DEAD/DEAH box helicase [Streptomyces sp. ISL-24]MBT2438513.1 DEAD/DEAH box helicase [Streptomyces sp. ISL-22]
MPRLPEATPSEISELARCRAVFLPGDPARAGRIAFWRADGDAVPLVASGSLEELTVALPGDDGVELVSVPAVLLPVRAALPVLTRARTSPQAPRAGVFWGTAALLGLQLMTRGLLLPGLSANDHDAWRAGPLRTEDVERIRALAAAMPPEAHAVPLESVEPLRLPDPERLLRAFLDAVADTLPRSPAAALVTGGPAYAAQEPQHLPGQRAWAADVAAGHDAGVRLSLRLEVAGLATATQDDAALSFRAVLQVHSVSDPTLVADAGDVWAGSGAFGPRARMDALLALRRAARAWNPLTPLLSAAVPNAVELADEEVTDLLGEGARALAGAGVDVHWPKELARELTARAVIGPPDDESTPGRVTSDTPAFLSADALLAFNWSFALGDRRLTREELDRLAEANRPVVRLRDQWVLVDPREVRRARAQQDRKVTPIDALGAALTGSTEVDGRQVEVRPTGWLAALRERLADPEGQEPVGQPAALAATLRDYQRRGLSWLARMTSLGLGCCLADDMGLGKTITLIALHLHRQSDATSAGPTLVVCPTSLMGNWQREIEKFAPGTRVRRFHGPRRDLDAVADGEFVLTTYGTMRLDARRLAEVTWGMVVADEAQHVKNPYSATARALRSLGARARVALTGTPVENNLSELWAILDWTTPGLLGRLGTFRARYAQAVEGGQDPAAAERLARLVRPFLLRRRKSDPGIAPELPPKTETDRAVSLTTEQAGLYEAVVRETLAEIAGADSMARRGLIVKLLTGLKQICNHPAQFLKEERPMIAGRSGKLELLDELLDTILSEGAGALVFTQYVRMGRLIEQHLASRGVPSQFLHGGTPVAEREALVGRFQDGEVPVFLLSLKAAGTGLNLTRAEHVVHYDRWWNPAVEAQATDRAYRIGQTRPVQVHRLIAEGTIEDRIADMLSRKRELADAVLGAGEAALTELTDKELADLVELRGGA